MLLDVLRQYWDKGLLIVFSVLIAGSGFILLWPAPHYELLVEEGKPLQLLAERPVALSREKPSQHRVPRAKTSLLPLSVSLNSASEEEFEQLPGIGPKLAQRIVVYRKQHGSFNQVSELDNVSGIGPRILAKLTPFLKI